MANNSWNWDARIETCNKQALHLMDAAETAESQVTKGEFLKVAGEWVKISAFIGAHLEH